MLLYMISYSTEKVLKKKISVLVYRCKFEQMGWKRYYSQIKLSNFCFLVVQLELKYQTHWPVAQQNLISPITAYFSKLQRHKYSRIMRIILPLSSTNYKYYIKKHLNVISFRGDPLPDIILRSQIHYDYEMLFYNFIMTMRCCSTTLLRCLNRISSFTCF